jgi:hypothetical protein
VRALRLGLLLTLAACASAQSETRAPTTAQPLPQPAVDAEQSLDAFGQKLYAALAQGHLETVMFDDVALRAVLLPDAATRITSVRLAAGSTLRLAADARALLQRAKYAGLCVQQGRAEPSAGAIGLRAPGFVFERALVIGREPGGGAVASWVEGEFLNTDAGFGALSLERVEPPRRDHADLDLAECEMRVGPLGHNP